MIHESETKLRLIGSYLFVTVKINGNNCHDIMVQKRKENLKHAALYWAGIASRKQHLAVSE